MIRYALHCANEHSFESWFRDSSAFDALQAAGQLACPSCGTAEVRKTLMAPSVVTSRAKRRRPREEQAPQAPAPRPETPAPEATQSATLLDDREKKLREMLRALHREITEKADNVGRAFAVEARRIHEGEVPPRSIYGEASREEVKALVEDGVPLLPLPTPPDEHN
jgi:hypothetical protein